MALMLNTQWENVANNRLSHDQGLHSQIYIMGSNTLDLS
ncbi:hypothetical protein BVRB_2g041120 [Beta vulgaris subsp. vulgaris]|nr:hypothetical protein BVRB_2g041120 [Beta vulgaris subsp. vulgaris]